MEDEPDRRAGPALKAVRSPKKDWTSSVPVFRHFIPDGRASERTYRGGCQGQYLGREPLMECKVARKLPRFAKPMDPEIWVVDQDHCIPPHYFPGVPKKVIDN